MQPRQLKSSAIRFARRRGWEVRHFDPISTSADYLNFVVFPQLQVTCVLDVGAHYGEFAQRLRNSGYDGTIISFEPIPSNFEILESNAASDPNWSVHNIALGRVDERSQMNVTENTVFSSLRSPLHDEIEEFEKFGNVVDHVETIDVRRLDGLFDEITGHIDHPRVFLKMDTQGWDLEVIGGAAASIDAVVGLQSEMALRPLYEAMPDFRTALSVYEELGFSVSSFYPVVWDQELRLVEFDCIMVRAAPPLPTPDQR